MKNWTLLGAPGLAALSFSILAGPALSQKPARDEIPNLYREQCAGCHGFNREGGFAPALTGAGFLEKWSAKSDALVNLIQQTMPPGAPNSLTAAQSRHLADSMLDAGTGSGSSDAPKTASAPERMSVNESEAYAESAGGGLAEGTTNFDDHYHRIVEQRKARLAGLSDVTAAMLAKTPPGSWLQVRRSDDSFAFSPLDQINRANAGELDLAWSLALPSGTNGITPLVHDGVMFVNSGGTVKALNVSDGDELWSFSRSAEYVPLGPPVSQPRGMAILGNLLYVPTVDNHMIALDTRSGKIVWDKLIEAPDATLRITAPPIIARGKILQGMSGCAGTMEKRGCFIVALDAKTGSEAWRFYTVPRQGEVGFDTWSNAPVDRRFGGSIWSAGTYDQKTGLVYFGTGQTYHIKPLITGGGTDNSALYTDSTLALDPDSGKLVWYYQHMQRDVWDLDWSFERVVYDMKTSAGMRRVISTVGKLGIMDVLDAKTGEYIASHDMGLQNLVTDIDPETGRKATDPAFEPEGNVAKHICPFAGGVRNWPSTSIDRERGVIFVPFTKSCMSYLYRPGQDFDISYAMEPPRDNDGLLGGVMAIGLDDLKQRWVQKQRGPAASGIVATSGGVIFAGDRDRWFRVIDSTDGSVLWKRRLDRRLSSNPITFADQGRQYVSITSGGGAPNDATQETLTPESARAAPGVTMWVFALRPFDKPASDAN